MSITGLHIPHGEAPLAQVTVNERDAMSYYPYVQGGPVEAGYLTIEGVDLVLYVNARYANLDDALTNQRASALFEMAGVGMWGGTLRGDALLVLGSGEGDYERSLPPELISTFMTADSTASASQRLELNGQEISRSERRASAQGVAEHLAALLDMLQVGPREGEGIVGITEEGNLELAADTGWALYEVLTDLLPECWRAETWYGYAVPEGCTLPDGLCASCIEQQRRLPRPAQ